MEKYKTIVEIHWWDADTLLDEWTNKDDVDYEIKEEEYKTHKSIGYFLKETDDYIAIIQNISDDLVANAIRIPKISIKDIIIK